MTTAKVVGVTVSATVVRITPGVGVGTTRAWGAIGRGWMVVVAVPIAVAVVMMVTRGSCDSSCGSGALRTLAQGGRSP
jgi:hypothetical protein